ncbi:SDR family oxidoreductase [Silvimonas sp. JCM 19000]
MQTLQQQRVVVMGGSSGIGLATAKRMAAAGAEVIATGRSLARLQAALPGHLTGVAVDATDRAALDAFFATTGPIDHLVLALGGGAGAGEFRELELAQLRHGFEAKFWPQLNALQASLAVLRGSVTLISAISARMAMPGVAGLAAINGALEAMVGTLARELSPLRVNAVAPGVVDTPWWDDKPAGFKAAVFDQQAATLPVRRVGQADDIAHAVQFLSENGFVSGTVIECDGGLHLL